MHPEGPVLGAEPSGSRAAKVGVPQATAQTAAVNLYWLPLGAGGHFVRFNGRVFEAAMALIHHRPIYDLYHSALEVGVPEGRFVIEQTPVPDSRGAARGVVAGGAVGSRWAGGMRLFRYEVRRWRDGVIADIAEAVKSPVLLSTDGALCTPGAPCSGVRARPCLGPRSVRHRRDVELEFDHRVDTRAQRHRRLDDPSTP
jgi:hypothetical protein